MKAVVAAFNQEKALVGAFSVITNLRMELFEALLDTGLTATHQTGDPGLQGAVARLHRRVGHRLDGVEGLVVNMLHGVLLQQRGVDRLDRVHILWSDQTIGTKLDWIKF